MSGVHKSERPVGAGRIAEGSTENAEILALGDQLRKARANIKAALALHGHAVHELADGGFLVINTRWGGLCRECPDLSALAAFARMLGVQP